MPYTCLARAAMVYNILGTAALISGTAFEIFQSSKRARTHESDHESDHESEPEPVGGVAGHLLHAPRGDGNGSGGVQTPRRPLDVQSSRAAGNDKDMVRGYLKDDRYVHRSRNEDFFYSLMHSTLHTRKMLEDIMQKLRYHYTDIQKDPKYADFLNNTVGEFLFKTLETDKVTLFAVIDAIQILKQQTDRYNKNIEIDTTLLHPLGWTTKRHYKACKQTQFKKPEYNDCNMSTQGKLPDSTQKMCPCCRVLTGTINNTSEEKCPICQKYKTQYPLVSDPKPVEDELYDGAAEHTAKNILAVSGHLASMLAIHAFMHNDLLRPGNFAPIYNVHLTMAYDETLCRGLLQKPLTKEEQMILAPIVKMMTYHELWINVPESTVSSQKNGLLQCASDGNKKIRTALYAQSKVYFRFEQHKKSNEENVDRITSASLVAFLQDKHLTRPGKKVSVKMSDLFSKHKIYWPCLGDYIALDGGGFFVMSFKENTNCDQKLQFRLIPRDVDFYIRQKDTVGYDSDNHDDQKGQRAKSTKLTDRKAIAETDTLFIKKTDNTVLSGQKKYDTYRSYRWMALPTIA